MGKRIKYIAGIVVGILMIPLIAMQFTEDVNWSLFDFLIAGLLLFVTGLSIDLVIRRVKGKGKRIAVIIAIVLLLALVWAELAVGIVGSPLGGN